MSLLVLPGLKAHGQSPAEDPLLVMAKATPYEWNAGQGGQLEIKLKLPPQFHAYEDKFALKVLAPEGFQISTPVIKPLVQWYDKFSKKNRQGVKEEATMTARLEAPDHFANNTDHLVLQLSYQACTDQYCLFPVTKTLDVPIQINFTDASTPPIATIKKVETTTEGTSFLDPSQVTRYLGSSLLLGLFVVFLAGILTSFTPCIFPMIPITLAVLGNHAEQRTRLQNFLTSCTYVLGIATTYSVLGLAAASSGRVFGATLGNPYILGIVCVIFLAMALGMYGLYDLQVPAIVRNRLGRGGPSKSFVGAYTTGLLAGIVASPCVGPVLVAILTYVASTQNKLWGFLFLFFYALGLGMIFILLGLFSQLRTFLPRSGGWMNLFKFVLGTLMLSAFYYYFSLLVPERFFDGALGVGLIVLASIYGAFLSSASITPIRRVQKGLMQAVLIIGAAYIALGLFDLRPAIRSHMIAGTPLNEIQQMKWQPYSEEALAQAKQNHRPVIIDFWAEWCVACHELEEKTFTDARIRSESGSFDLLKFDATNETPQLSAMKKKFKLQGLPTVVFINADGQWQEALTLSAFEDAAGFIKRMDDTGK